MDELSFGELAHIASDWVWESDAAHRMCFLSDRIVELTDVPSDRSLGLRRDESAANPDDEAFWRPHLADLDAHRPFRDFVYPRRGPDGALRWLRVSGIPRFAADGAFLGYRGVGTNVTREKEREDELVRALAEAERARLALEEQNRRFDTALENMAEGVIMLDAALDLIVCNRRYLEIMGLSPDVVRPGVSFRAIIAHGVERGRNPGHTVERLYAERLALVARGEAATLLTEMAGGRVVETTYRPMAGGGWVATYQDITGRVVAETALREQNRRFDAALAHMSHGLVMVDETDEVVVVNAKFLEFYGLTPDAVHPGMTMAAVIECSVAVGNFPGSNAVDIIERRRARLAQGVAVSLRQVLPNGRILSIHFAPLAGRGWVTVYEDITEQALAEEALREQNRRFDTALSHMSQGLCMLDEDMRVLVLNQRYIDLYGLDPAVVQPGVTMREIMEHSVALGNHPGTSGEALYQGYRELLARDGSVRIHREISGGRSIAISHGAMPGGGWVATYEDVTERRQAEARIAHMARHDALTGLPNRVLLRERLEAALERVAREGSAFAIHCLDLDQFKAVNDTLGHPVGDTLLGAVAARLRDHVPPDAVLARLGGDEFALIQPFEDRTEVDALARTVIDAVSAPYDLGDHQVVIGTSVGVALAPIDAADADALLKHADLALYQAKADGRGVCRFFEAGMDARILARRALELDLRAALAREEFELWYQPQVDATTGEVQGFEALLRWNHPTRGLVPPDAFIPLAEEVGLIVPIGEWVIRQACREAAAWPGQLRVAVNISPAQFTSRTLELAVVSALARSGLSPRRLELEITETVLLVDTEAAIATLHRLRTLGVRISMDDFGTGYSSLSYLRAFPFDKIKIDRSFVRDLAERPDCSAIVEAVAGLGAKLGMITTAEGVETVEQLDLVRAKGCTEVQGFLISRPLRPDALEPFLVARLGPREMRRAARG